MWRKCEFDSFHVELKNMILYLDTFVNMTDTTKIWSDSIFFLLFYSFGSVEFWYCKAKVLNYSEVVTQVKNAEKC